MPQPRKKPGECPAVGRQMEKGVTEETHLRYNGHESPARLTHETPERDRGDGRVTGRGRQSYSGD